MDVVWYARRLSEKSAKHGHGHVRPVQASSGAQSIDVRDDESGLHPSIEASRDLLDTAGNVEQTRREARRICRTIDADSGTIGLRHTAPEERLALGEAAEREAALALRRHRCAELIRARSSVRGDDRDRRFEAMIAIVGSRR